MSHATIDCSKLAVLVLDDSKFMLNLTESILKSYGFGNVVLASSVNESEIKLAQYEFDFAFVDWHMEPQEGLEFVRRVRAGATGPNPYLPMVMLTGHGSAAHVCKARDAGVNSFLVKPMSGESVYRHIVALVEDRRPYIRTRSYIGPDRRRADVGPPRGMKDRRHS